MGFSLMVVRCRWRLPCGVGRVYLRVRAANAAAIALYERLGFQTTGRYTYPDAAGGLEMAINLELARAVVPTSSTEGAA
jgi:ribosomal protein S18 acetylase RimI-like enzyme